MRRLTASSALVDYLAWPGLQQVFEIERTVTYQRTGQQRRETVYGITSLPPQRADAARLLSLVRQHWAIENRSHSVRDVTYDEDRSQVRCGSIPQTMAALRNLAIRACFRSFVALSQIHGGITSESAEHELHHGRIDPGFAGRR